MNSARCSGWSVLGGTARAEQDVSLQPKEVQAGLWMPPRAELGALAPRFWLGKAVEFLALTNTRIVQRSPETLYARALQCAWIDDDS